MQVLGEEYEESAVTIGPFQHVWAHAAQGVAATIIGRAPLVGGKTARMIPPEMVETIRLIAFRIYERQRKVLARNVSGWKKLEDTLKEAFDGESA